MTEQRDSRNGQKIQAVEMPKRHEVTPAAAPVFLRGRQDAPSRTQPQTHMPNGDPPSVMLWGSEEG